MGQNKAFLDFHGKAWIVHQIESILDSHRVHSIFIVVRGDQLERFHFLTEMFSQVRIVENSFFDSEPGDSLKLAIQSDEFPRGALVSPIDTPVFSSTLNQIIDEIVPSTQVLKPTFQDRGGHPLYLSQKVLLEFVQNKEKRLDLFLKNKSETRISVNDPYILKNLNTEDDWMKFLEAH